MISKSDRTRQFIIEKSAPIFNKKGYAGTSMADILEATGLAKGGIYGNFTSKDEIAAEAFDYGYAQVRDALRALIKQQQTATKKLGAILRFYHNYTIQPLTEGGCPVLNTAIDADDQLPFLKEKARQAMQEMLDSLRHIIQKGIDKGEFRADIQAAAEAEHFFAVVEGGIMMAKLLDSPAVLNRLLDSQKQYIEAWENE